MQVSIPRRLLAAVSRTAAIQDVRYYLNGLFIEAKGAEVRLVATDGNILSVARFSWPLEDDFEVIIPPEALAHAIKQKSEAVGLTIKAGQFSLAGLAFTPVEGRFPDYRRVIPKTVSGEAGNYSPEFLAVFSKAGKDLKHRGAPIVRQNGKNAALVHFYGVEDFVGVVVPLRHFTEKRPDLGMPTWAGM